MATLKQVIEQEAAQLRQLNAGIPRDLETITHKCLDKSKARRYGSAQALADDLQRFRSGEPILARPISVVERCVRWCQRHPSSAFNAVAVVLLVLGSAIAWTLYQAHDRELRAQAKATSLVEQLNLAGDDMLASAVEQTRSNPFAMSMLHEQFQNEPTGSELKYRAAIALISTDSTVVDEICEALPGLSWNEWSYVTGELTPFAMQVNRWWTNKVFEANDKLSNDRFVRIAATAAWLENLSVIFRFDAWPRGSFDIHTADNTRRIVDAVLIELARDPTLLREASAGLKPLRADLGPALAKKLEYTEPSGASDSAISASLLAKLFHDEPQKLFALSWAVRGDALPLLISELTDSEELRGTLRQAAQSQVSGGTWDEQNLARRRAAVAGLGLAQLGEWRSVWPLLSHQTDPSMRSLLIEWLPRTIHDPSIVLQQTKSLLSGRARHLEALNANLDAESAVPNRWLFDDPSSQLRACVQILGNYSTDVLRRHINDSYWESLEQVATVDPDPGVHAACEWMMRRHHRPPIAETVAKTQQAKVVNNVAWRTTANGHCLVTLQGPIDFVAGANKRDPDRDAGETLDPVDQSREVWSEDHPHPKYIPRSFEIAAHETQFSQFQKFDKDFHISQNKTLGPTLQHPACQVTWYRAAAYCNWLSEQENIDQDQWCFLPNAAGEYAEGMSLAPDYLHRSGFRLPTEAEWEYACRAGTVTRRYFGDTDELMDRYVWYINNSHEKILLVPGTLLPNELGLFDMFGNVMEWCMDEFYTASPGSRFRKFDIEQAGAIAARKRSHLLRLLRGSSLWDHPWEVRASEYASFSPSYHDGNTGFRVARTLTNFPTR